ncbi:ferredoxin reductase family protein [Halomonas ventosae]|uniref:Putative ferric reductase n=1 Tax=Halomonas ventosae TaxID=229007 RepID=A0A2T0VMI5_9GAMM|nr:ferric reductase-like transmembrane domain-containing protein [Halomonas ventosae]PRY71519.1 putative ferric reductase [Halomonas ventosae]
MRHHPRAGDLVLLAAVLLPLVVALPRLGWPATDAGAWLAWVGRAAGILGLAMLLLAATTSIRVPGWDRAFGGLARLWRLHHALGFGAFVLLMAHALALALAAVPLGLSVAVDVLFPPLSRGAIWLGWLAWLAMLLFLTPTFGFFGRPRYQTWKRLHLVSAAALLLALAHALPLAGEAWPWWLLGLAGLAAIAWRKLGSHRARLAYRIEAVEPLARGVVELVLAPQGRRLVHEPGQFVYLAPLDATLSAGRGEEHPYTLASAPADGRLRIGIKDLGDASHALQTATPGSMAQVEGPYGDFFGRHPTGRDRLWLGGGIGITPFVGGARDLLARGVVEGQVLLIYLANRPERAYYLDELEAIAERLAGFSVVAHYYLERGALDLAFLTAHCPDVAEREIHLCGPPAMNAHLRRLLAGQGVPRSRIHSEVLEFL